MTKQEMLELRTATFLRVEQLRKVGDHSAEAPDVRKNAECLLQLIDHLLERMR
jgi:hypothetical protein